MTVAGTSETAHVPVMDTRDDTPERLPGVSETAPAWTVAPDPLLARPRRIKLDAEALVRDMHARFPIIMARLAE